MQTVDKAMHLLNMFTVQQPEIGLSELARMSGFDKAATRRFLVALMNHQFIEQNPTTRDYRLGVGFLKLSKIREATVPLESIVLPSLARLRDKIGETAHGNLLINDRLSAIGVNFPNRGNRAHVEVGENLPLHATAAGIVFLAYADPKWVEEWMRNLPDTLSTHADATVTDLEQLKAILAGTRDRGIAEGKDTYCHEVTGFAVPYFSADGLPLGTIAIAVPNSRLTDGLNKDIKRALIEETLNITASLGGQFPSKFQAVLQRWQQRAA